MLLPLAILLALIASLWWTITKSAADAMLDVYLPILMLVPAAYEFEVPHVMLLSIPGAALIPIAAIALLKYRRLWRFQRADLWILLFAVGDGIAEGRHAFSQGLRGFAIKLLAAFFPYILGKLLIEQAGIRVKFLRRMFELMTFVAVLEVIEFRLGRNLFTMAGDLVFPSVPSLFEQVRGGFERARGPYGSAITAGALFGSAWILSLWLSYVERRKLGAGEPRWLGFRRSVILMWGLFAGLIMALSRGPWLGAAVAFGISLIGSAKHVKRTAVLVLLFGTIGGMAVYSYLDAYTSGDIADAKNQDQENAIYRRLLLDNYAPIIKEGGVFGWGEGFPRVQGQPSIDNYYLWLRLTQGPWGLVLFLLLAGESSVALLVIAKRAEDREDFYFAITLLAVIVGMLTTLTTVSLGAPAYQLLFLIFGWSLSLRTEPRSQAAPAALTESQGIRIFA